MPLIVFEKDKTYAVTMAPKKRAREAAYEDFRLHGNLTERGRAAIETLIREGHPNCVIAEKVCMDPSSISRIRSKMKQGLPHGRTYECTGESPEVIDRRSKIEELCDDGGELVKQGATQIARVLAAKHEINVGRHTVQRDLKVLGLSHFKRPFCPLITEAQAEKRLAVATTLLEEMPRSQMEHIVFSDESMFDCVCTRNGQWAVSARDVEPRERQKWGARAHVWGIIGVGLKKLVILKDPIVNKETYQATIRTHVLPLWRYKKERIWQHDNAPAHTAQCVKDFLREHGIKTVEWPANSPDLSPIENMWALVKSKLPEDRQRTNADLHRKILEAWDAVSQETVDNLVKSFRGRLLVCVEEKGAWTGY